MVEWWRHPRLFLWLTKELISLQTYAGLPEESMLREFRRFQLWCLQFSERN